MNASGMIALVFLAIILLGTLLLSLPVAARSGQSCGLLPALFTATSATCVTGLSLFDTWSQWSGFGQVVILCLIEVGGLGFMSAASLVIFLLRKRVGMKQRMVMAQAIGVENLGDILRIQRRLLAGCLGIEGVGALLLTLRFAPTYGLGKGLWMGIFHSVSAFCNAGFDVLGFQGPGTSLIHYGTDPVICLVLSALIVVGGLGFLVWDEIYRVRQPKRWSVYTKLVLLTTAALLVAGTVLFCLTEWRNPATLGSMTLPEKLLAGFFQSVTTRTAGFAAIDQGAMTEAGKAVCLLFMLIGGSSGSTAGGLKTVTFVVLILFLWARARGKETVDVFHRTIRKEQVLNALTIFCIMVLLSFAGGVLICATSPVGFTDSLYESVSALATVGLSTGITASLSLPARLLMIVYMYFGRVGILTISLGFLQERKSARQYTYAETSLLIG
jgi:trk system potassium uptake protein TrkH